MNGFSIKPFSFLMNAYLMTGGLDRPIWVWVYPPILLA
jgi:hypothetical protein